MADEPAPAGLVRAAWRQELKRAGALFATALLGGLMFDALAEWLLAALALYLAHHLRQIRSLARWVEHPKRVELPEAGGIWGEIYEQLLEIQKSNRKRKKRLAEMLAQFQASTAALPDGAVVLGPAGEIVWFNDAARQLLGLHWGQDLGLRIANLLRHPEFTEYFERGDYTHDVEMPSPEHAQVTLSVRVIPYGEDQRLLIARDVSAIKRLEAARRDFVANASHELRTPLTVLRGYVDMMEPEAAAGGPLASWRQPLTEMRAQATRMEALIADLLKLARLESDAPHARPEIIDVPAMLAALLDETRALSKGQHTIEGEIDPDVRLVGRDLEVESIFANLLTNAVQYTPPGGTIRLTWSGDDRGAHLAVADTGIGIPERDIPRVTERFYRVDVARSRARGGTGLGLAIVKHALERHGGTLTIDSKLGHGSTFACHFPAERVRRSRGLAANE